MDKRIEESIKAAELRIISVKRAIESLTLLTDGYKKKLQELENTIESLQKGQTK